MKEVEEAEAETEDEVETEFEGFGTPLSRPGTAVTTSRSDCHSVWGEGRWNMRFSPEFHGTAFVMECRMALVVQSSLDASSLQAVGPSVRA